MKSLFSFVFMNMFVIKDRKQWQLVLGSKQAHYFLIAPTHRSHRGMARLSWPGWLPVLVITGPELEQVSWSRRVCYHKAKLPKNHCSSSNLETFSVFFSSHGILLFLSITTSVTDCQFSRLVAFFHVHERPIFSALKSTSMHVARYDWVYLLAASS